MNAIEIRNLSKSIVVIEFQDDIVNIADSLFNTLYTIFFLISIF